MKIFQKIIFMALILNVIPDTSFAKMLVDEESSTVSEDFERTLVILSVSKQPIDFDAPWKRKDISNLETIGISIDKRFILTTADAVSQSTLIEMTRIGANEKEPLQVFLVDYEINLALLKPTKGEIFEDLLPIKLADPIRALTDVQVLKNRGLNQFSQVQAKLAEVGIFQVTTSRYSALHYVLEQKQTLNLNTGEPLIKDKELIGVTSDVDNNQILAIPSPIIQKFVNDAKTGNYKGFSSLGLVTSPLSSAVIKDWLKVPTHINGVRVHKVFIKSPFFNLLQSNDVITKISNQSLNSYGRIRHRVWGFIPFNYLLNMASPGDEIELDVYRNGSPLKIKAPLSAFNSNNFHIPAYRTTRDEPLLIFGGLVFQELSLPFLTQWGKQWEQVAPTDLVYLNEIDELNSFRDERMILLNRILADKFNTGYEERENLVLESVNGVLIHSMEQLHSVLQKQKIKKFNEDFAVFKFKRGTGEIILSYKGLKDAQERIAKNYGINSPKVFYTD